MKKHIFIAVGLAAMLAGLGFMMMSLSKDDVMQWATYRSDAYAYQIAYPAGVVYAMQPSDSDPRIVRFPLAGVVAGDSSAGDVSSTSARFGVTVSVLKLWQNKTLEEWIAFERSALNAAEPTRQEKITIAGQDAYVLEYPVSEGERFHVAPYAPVVYYVKHGTNQYRITGLTIPIDINPDEPTLPAAKEYTKLFNEMLNSLTFIQ